MSKWRILVALVLITATASGQDVTKEKRYEVEEDIVKYPQQTPQQAMNSVAKTLSEGRLDYLLAHLVDPLFVDAKIQLIKSKLKGPPKAVEMVAFDKLIQEIKGHFLRDPMIVEEMSRYAKEGIWEMKDNQANARLPDVLSRRVYFIQVKGRWYLQNER
jgi:hypothetical protein